MLSCRRHPSGAPAQQAPSDRHPWVTAAPGLSPARPPARRPLGPARRAASITIELRENGFDLYGSDTRLCRLRHRIHPFGRGPGVLLGEGVRVRPQALCRLPGQSTGITTDVLRVRHARHRRTARLRAGRTRGAGAFRGLVHDLWESGPGAVQAADGPAGLLLGLLSRAKRRLIGICGIAPRPAPYGSPASLSTPRSSFCALRPVGSSDMGAEAPAITGIATERIGDRPQDQLHVRGGQYCRPSQRWQRLPARFR